MSAQSLFDVSVVFSLFCVILVCGLQAYLNQNLNSRIVLLNARLRMLEDFVHTPYSASKP